MPPLRDTPELVPLIAVARALGPLRERVVFIGGAIAPLLQTAPAGSRIRPTDDVDAVVSSTTYTAAARVEDELRQLGFRHAMDSHHAHRWRAPDDTPFDLVPSGTHLGATGSDWELLAIGAAVVAEVFPGLAIRHASAAGFLALKWAAFLDRGADDPWASHDLEDILTLLASRPGIEDEVAAAPARIRGFIGEQAARILAEPARRDLLAASLSPGPDPARSMAAVERVLRILAT